MNEIKNVTPATLALLDACQTFCAWLDHEEAGFDHDKNDRKTLAGEAAWREWWERGQALCAAAQGKARRAIAMEGVQRAQRAFATDLAEEQRNTATALLAQLVTALEGAHISSWQSTHAWQAQLDAASRWLVGGAGNDGVVPGEAYLFWNADDEGVGAVNSHEELAEICADGLDDGESGVLTVQRALRLPDAKLHVWTTYDPEADERKVHCDWLRGEGGV